MKSETRCIVDSACELGEGPIWDSDRQRLLWVDIFGKSVFAYHPESGKVQRWQVDEMIGFVLPTKGKGDRWVAGLASGLAMICLGEASPSEAITPVEFFDRPAKDEPEARFNDGACDAEGRLWCGTMHMPVTQTAGKLYCYDRSTTARVMDDGYLVTNGPAFSRDGKTLYHTESVGGDHQPQGIFAFDLSADGSIRNKRLHIDYRNRSATPDGLMVDADDRLWVGEWDGSQLACFDPWGKLVQEIPLPTANVTKAAFGGKNLDVLYVTTATVGLSKEQLAEQPQAGGLFEIRGVGRGIAPGRYTPPS